MMVVCDWTKYHYSIHTFLINLIFESKYIRELSRIRVSLKASPKKAYPRTTGVTVHPSFQKGEKLQNNCLPVYKSNRKKEEEEQHAKFW
ncbi:hypothetical protein E2C01_097111 [Portunus trituberculatus]|uniref:Uncharacterized protein n=1 Tax=Portunus trituberculatus TaxID=210409 RepID=A0A5B7K4V5_PORTR|nr:hypothetical protein [Portunus trituberculatus]